MEKIDALIYRVYDRHDMPPPDEVILIKTDHGWYRPFRASMKTWVCILILPKTTYGSDINVFAVKGNRTDMFRQLEEVTTLHKIYGVGFGEMVYRKALMCITATGDIHATINYEKREA